MLFISGCSYRTSEFFEDIFAENKVIKAEGQFQKSVGKDPKQPILYTKPDNASAHTFSDKPKSYRGKIASVHFDRDFNLYLYTFIDHITHKPVIFYYDKNIQQKSYKGDYRIVVKGNYLITYKQLASKATESDSHIQANSTEQKPYKIRKTYKRRKRSSIKVPIEEKINPL